MQKPKNVILTKSTNLTRASKKTCSNEKKQKKKRNNNLKFSTAVSSRRYLQYKMDKTAPKILRRSEHRHIHSQGSNRKLQESGRAAPAPGGALVTIFEQIPGGVNLHNNSGGHKAVADSHYARAPPSTLQPIWLPTYLGLAACPLSTTFDNYWYLRVRVCRKGLLFLIFFLSLDCHWF